MKINLKLVGIIVIVILSAVGFFIFKKQAAPKAEIQQTTTPTKEDSSPKIVSTKPDPLENTIIPADGIIEITFNAPLQNSGEFKTRIEPKVEYKIELSQDRKTAKIIFQQALELGRSFTLFIGPETKFDGVQNWGQEKIYHFHTVSYKGV